MSKIKGDVRTSQLILTYGVGSLVALGEESFIVTGLDYWDVDEDDELHEPRLERMLRVNRFYRPKAGDETLDVPVRRFPMWYQCPDCDRIDEVWKFGGAWTEAVCKDCAAEPHLIPSRFVTACARGHIDDFPYFSWAHSTQRHSDATGRARLSLKAAGTAAGLADITVQCSCGASRSMDGALGRSAMDQVGSCRGKRPWLDGEPEECNETPRTLQRGASNVWFSVPSSAISIPPWSEGVFRLLDRHWRVLRVVPEIALEETIAALLGDTGEYKVDDLVEAARQRKLDESGTLEERSLKQQEHEALVRGRPEVDRQQQFVCVPAESAGRMGSDWFDQIQQVRRLREVKALRGFTRLLPPAGSGSASDDRLAPMSIGEIDWLPAIEVVGEGVYFELSSDRLATWESRPDVEARVSTITRNWQSVGEMYGGDPLAASPRGVLVHTLAHVIIDQWALECGYADAALTERLYIGESMAGFLIYTATTDSAGSLGGVVAMTENDRFDSSLRQAIDRAAWCSADPLCVEAAAGGVDSLNLAACHACVLLPETSCEQRNVLLDRATLIGTPEHPEIGFFHGLLGD